MNEVTVTEAQIFRTESGLWYWHSRGANHEILASGEGYKDKADALAACRASIPEGIEPEVKDE